MATPQPTPHVNIFEQIANDAQLSAKVNSLVSRVNEVPGLVSEQTDLNDLGLDERQLKSLLLTFVNGSADMHTQRVHVEYLKQDQKMTLPLPLAMLPFDTANPEVSMHPILTPRYWRATRTPYARMKQMLVQNFTAVQVREFVQTIALPQPEDMTSLYNWPATYTVGDGDTDDPAAVAITFGWFSNCLQFNCDIRDVGILSRAEMRMPDDAWKTIANESIDRLACRIQAYSIQSIAAMNMESCQNCPLAAWTRAYGVGCGILPSRASKLQKEYYYTCTNPPRAQRLAIIDFEDKTEEPLYPIAMNLFAMFGLFHLSKDHTFRTGDANMDRIGLSYLTTLRTMVHSTLMDDMKAHQEALVRTAQHPFGLGQTYAVSILLYRHERLATPLRLRITATPPPVQRLYIVMAAKDEWGIMPIGPTIIDIFGKHLDIIKDETDVIMRNSPAYSGLYDLYGIDKQLTASIDAYKAASTLLPVVYGYAMVQHSDTQSRKEGLALALSLQNVASQHRTLSMQWQRMWEAYIEKSDKEGLEKFLKTAYAASIE